MQLDATWTDDVSWKISFEAVKKFEYGRISSLFERI